MKSIMLKKSMAKLGVIFLVTGAFSGFFPIAPGTAGSVVGLGLVWLLRDISSLYSFLVCALLFAAGVWASDKASQTFKMADAPQIVIDEIVGMMLTMIGIPVTAYWLVCGFLIFRLFDVVKFPPANYFDTRLKNGWGVMLDDVSAGIYGNLLLRLMLRANF